MGAPTASDDDPWLDAFVTDFLTRAREQKYVVAEGAFGQALDRLRNTVVNAPEPDKANNAALAYALYVLARNGRPVIGDLRYLTDAKLDAFATPLAKAQLGAALAMLGDRARAGKVFAAALTALAAEKDTGLSRPDYGSRLRDAAAVLALVAEANPAAGDMPADAIARAGAEVDAARADRAYTSTQENGWMVLAAEGLAEHGSLGAFTVDGQPVKGALNRRFGPDALSGRSATIANTGQATAQLVTTVSGSPIAPEPAASNGYAVERTIYSLDGKTIDLEEPRAEPARRGGAEGDGSGSAICPAPDRRPSAGRARDRQSGAGRRRLGRGLLVADDRGDAGAYGISRRPVRRGVRPRAGAVGLHRSRLCRARRRARPLRLAAGDGGSHVRPRTLRPHRLRRAGGDGEVSPLSEPGAPTLAPPSPLAGEGVAEGDG